VKKYLLIFLLPLIATAADVSVPEEKETFMIAPLMPLLPGDPLELNLKLRHTLYEEDQSQHNLAVFKSYTIPWLAIIPLLLLALIAPFFLYVVKNFRSKVQGPSVYTLIQQMQALQNSSLPPKELAFQVAKLFKMGFENGPYLTYQELYEQLKGKYSSEELALLKLQFNNLEMIQYQKAQPSLDQVREAITGTEHFLQSKL
jgi:hypothetical protein